MVHNRGPGVLLKCPIGLLHWNAHDPCHECDGENWEGCALEKAVKEIRLEKQNFKNTAMLSTWQSLQVTAPCFNWATSPARMSRGTLCTSFLQGTLWSRDWWNSSLLLLERRPRKNMQEEALGKAVCAV